MKRWCQRCTSTLLPLLYNQSDGVPSTKQKSSASGLPSNWRKQLAKIPSRVSESRASSANSLGMSAVSSSFENPGTFDQDESDDAILAARKSKSRVKIQHYDEAKEVKTERGRQMSQVRH